MTEKPWRDADKLREEYIENELNLTEIADKWGCSQALVSKWKRKHNIEKSERWEDPERLRELYINQKLPTRKVAEEFGVSRSTIIRELDKHSIPIRDRSEAHQLAMWSGPATYTSDMRGYQEWRTTIDRETKHAYVHRLLAVAEYGFDAVESMEVHHKNGIKWDNRPDNIELMDPTDHRQTHAAETNGYIGKNKELYEG